MKDICVGDIIEYSIENKVIIHRVVNIIEGSGEQRTFITKGDSNNAPDANPVEESQVLGVAKNYIPYIGYTSVIFSEKILKLGE